MATSSVSTYAFYVKKRGRQCRLAATKGSAYCGEHLIHDRTGQSSRTRVVCPLDTSHTVFEDQLSKHVRKCSASKKTAPSCYRKGVNGMEEVMCGPILPLSEYPHAVVKDLIERINIAYERENVGDNVVDNGVLSHSSLDGDLSDPSNGPSALKHLKQQASIVGHMDTLGLLLSSNAAYIEFGAGRGKLSEKIQQALCYPDNVHFVLVDKASCRRKVDGSLRSSSLVGMEYHRLHMDIEHFNLKALEVLQCMEHVMAVGKHLCGSATDLTLRCLVNARPPQLRGVLIALCCHHRVQWSQLTDQEYFVRLGFTPEEFQIISQMSSWAVCGMRSSEKQGYVPHPNEAVGLKCKRLIDFSRLAYLRSNGMNARLLYYVEKDTSLENTLIVATVLSS